MLPCDQVYPPLHVVQPRRDPKASLVATAEEVELQKQLLGVAQKCLSKSTDEDGLSMDFYVTFWRLSLQDILCPQKAMNESCLGSWLVRGKMRTQRQEWIENTT